MPVMREPRIKPRYCDRIGMLYLSEALPERQRQGDRLRNAIRVGCGLEMSRPSDRARKAGGPRDQDAVASPPMGCPADAVFLASAMKLRAAKNSETQVKAIASDTTSVIADWSPTARNTSVIWLVPAAAIACLAYMSDNAPVTTGPKPAPRTY